MSRRRRSGSSRRTTRRRRCDPLRNEEHIWFAHHRNRACRSYSPCNVSGRRQAPDRSPWGRETDDGGKVDYSQRAHRRDDRVPYLRWFPSTAGEVPRPVRRGPYPSTPGAPVREKNRSSTIMVALGGRRAVQRRTKGTGPRDPRPKRAEGDRLATGAVRVASKGAPWSRWARVMCASSYRAWTGGVQASNTEHFAKGPFRPW
jgi:hypothetical protein